MHKTGFRYSPAYFLCLFFFRYFISFKMSPVTCNSFDCLALHQFSEFVEIHVTIA